MDIACSDLYNVFVIYIMGKICRQENQPLRLSAEKSSWPRLLAFPILAVAAIVFFIVREKPDLAFAMAYCPLRDKTGIPCLTCGGTHCLVELVQGHWLAAFITNPLVSIGSIALILWAFYSLIATFCPRIRRQLELSDREKRTAKILAVLFILLTWAWLLRQFSA